MNELRMFHDKYTKARKKLSKAKPTCNTSRPLLDLLPTRDVCDEAVASYFRTCEKSLRILHQPSFMDDYRRFWNLAEHDRD